MHEQKTHQRHADDDRDHVDNTPDNVDEHRSPSVGQSVSRSSCPGSSRASTSFLVRWQGKTWMAGTSPAMTAEMRRYGVMEIGEKSTNQLFGCTNPLIF